MMDDRLRRATVNVDDDEGGGTICHTTLFIDLQLVH